MSLHSLIEEKNVILKRINELHEQSIKKEFSKERKSIEQNISLLQRRCERIIRHIEEKCDHKWSDPDWGYLKCAVCEKLKSTRNC